MCKKGKNENVVEMADYRRRKKVSFLAENRGRLEHFFQRFVDKHFKVNIDVFNALYSQQKLFQNELAWDYYDFREDLGEAIRSVYGPLLWEEINKERWFNAKCVSYDEAIERCTSEFILASEKTGFGGL